MPTEFVEAPADQFYYGTDWTEIIGDHSPGTMTISLGRQEAVLVGKIPANKMRTCSRFFLGHAFTLNASPYKLYREPPQPHPVWPHLRAYDITFTPMSPAGNAALANKVQVASPFNSPATFSGQPQLKYGNYSHAFATVRFRDFGRMRFLPDSAITTYADEYRRWTTATCAPSVQALTAEGSSQLIYAEGAGPPDGPTVGNAFNAPVAELVAKAAYSLAWKDVPFDYLSSNDNVLTPWKMQSSGTNTRSGILPLLGYWNNTEFLGFPIGTMLLTAVTFDPMQYVVPTSNDDYPLTGYSVQFLFEHFDPIKGVAASDKRGHRLFPYRIDGKWYWCTRKNGADFLYGADLNKLFRHVLDNS